jgi:hypothetical protein
MHTRLVLILAALFFGPAGAEQAFRTFGSDGPSSEYIAQMLATYKLPPSEVARLATLAHSRNKESPAAGRTTYQQLVRLNNYEYEDCTGAELRARQSICATLRGALRDYCKQCVDKFISYCADDPYKVLEALVGAPALARVKNYEADFDEHIKQNNLDTSALEHESSVKTFVSSLDLFKRLAFKRVCSIYYSKFNDLVEEFKFDRETVLDRLRLSPDAAHPNSRRGLAEAEEDCKIVKYVNCYQTDEQVSGNVRPASFEGEELSDRIERYERITTIRSEHDYKYCNVEKLSEGRNSCAKLADSNDSVLCLQFVDEFKSFCANNPFEVLKASLRGEDLYPLRRYEAKLDDFIKKRGLSADGDERQATVLEFYRSLNGIEGPEFLTTCRIFFKKFNKTMQQFEQDRQTTLDRIRQHPDASNSYSSRSIAEAVEDCRIVNEQAINLLHLNDKPERGLKKPKRGLNKFLRL